MSRYDVYPNPDGAGYLLDIQSDLLDELNTRLVAPLLPLNDAPKPARRLNPIFEIDGETVMMATQFLAAVPTAVLQHRVASLDARHDDIVSAVDFLLYGF
jgi:toxin CcdB